MSEAGKLYVVATPIGNLEDISQRALHVLTNVDRIAAEDTRHSGRLLKNFGIQRPLLSLHEHNEGRAVESVMALLMAGESLALISDAGTPLISDPGYPLVRAVRKAGLDVIPVPGASAAIAALSVSGLPTDRFVFEGFLPAKSAQRIAHLQSVTDETRTLVFYESSHRIIKSLADMQSVFGDDREVVIARELTKMFEQIQGGTLAVINAWILEDTNHTKGEFVVIVHGAPKQEDVITDKDRRILQALLQTLPVKQAAALTAEITGHRKNELYELALKMKA